MITLPDDKILTAREAKLKSPVELAFVGDAVYELMVRRHISLTHDCPASRLHTLSVSFVRAEAQQAAYRLIEPVLSEEEKDAFRRGRNANKVTASKHADAASYRAATGLEALFGYLYLTGDTGRIEELFGIIAGAAESGHFSVETKTEDII